MARSVTVSQDELLRQPVTRPVFLIDILVDAQEHLSTNGDLVVGDTVYTASTVELVNIDDWRQAKIGLPSTPARTQQFLSQSWRSGACKVWLVPSVYAPFLIDDDYVEDDYALEGYVIDAPILLVDGELTEAEKGENIVFTVENRISIGRWLPGIRLAAPVFNHLPKAGRVFVWEGERFTLEAR